MDFATRQVWRHNCIFARDGKFRKALTRGLPAFFCFEGFCLFANSSCGEFDTSRRQEGAMTGSDPAGISESKPNSWRKQTSFLILAVKDA